MLCVAVLVPRPAMLMFGVISRRTQKTMLKSFDETSMVEVYQHRRALKSTSVLRSASPGVSSGCTKRCWAMPLRAQTEWGSVFHLAVG